MRRLSIREMRAILGRLDQVVEDAGELELTRHGKSIARILPMRKRRKMPSHAALRAEMPRLRVPSESLVRRDRDER